MKKLDISALRKSVVFYISIGVFILITLALLSISITAKKIQDKKESNYSLQVNKSIKHVLSHFLEDYTYLARRIVETTNLPQLLENKDRAGIYKYLKPKFDLMKEENTYLNIMHVHLSDGNSFLRVHKPDMYGDKISEDRIMLREIHKNHKLISGYETGKYSTVYRVISPIFNKAGKYLGAFEVGVNPNFIKDAVYDINGFCGIVLIKENQLKLYSKSGGLIIDGYRLQSTLNKKLKTICEKFKLSNHLEENMQIKVGDKTYLTHILTLKNFQQEDSVKVVFFQDITGIGDFLNASMYKLYSLMFFVFLILTFFIYRRIGIYQERVEGVYIDARNELEFNKNYLQAVFDSSTQIMITTDGKELDRANPAMLKFFNFPSIEEFMSEHDCICDYFLNEKGYLQREVNGRDWLEYILINSKKLHKVCMKKDNKKHYFTVSAHELEIDSKKRSVATFNDITQVKELEILLSNTINSVSNLIFVKNNEFQYIEFNKAFEEFVGKTRDEMLFKSDYDLFDEEIANFFRQKDEEMLQSSFSKANYEWVTYPDGHEVYLYTFKAPLHDSEGNILGLVGNSVDLTKEKLLESKLKDQEEIMISQSRHAAMGEMISMIAHQWRQPISVISMDASNILADIELENIEEDSLKILADDIISQTQELSKTIDDFRNFFKSEKEAVECTVFSILSDALGIISSSLKNNDIDLVLDVDENTKIKTYSRELMQVLVNIIKNAKEVLVERDVDNKEISIELIDVAEYLKLKICDNAGGIEDDIMSRIFEPYFTTKGEKNGTGLGLYMSKTIIEKHLHGSLNVSNTDDGVCFEIELPYEIKSIEP